LKDMDHQCQQECGTCQTEHKEQMTYCDLVEREGSSSIVESERHSMVMTRWHGIGCSRWEVEEEAVG
jgi:hypothetical protein